ncbi:formin-like protein 3 isoform X1 [Iris pallida]|uniref:Formin-like protein 3 isoform X1 n=1 Tax=Iris pallida TaxID=29817 RepID=A0AAX6HCW2_IRIPA|nr:formin-like protein 3 isoform X1 [Iris pallida]
MRAEAETHRRSARHLRWRGGGWPRRGSSALVWVQRGRLQTEASDGMEAAVVSALEEGGARSGRLETCGISWRRAAKTRPGWRSGAPAGGQLGWARRTPNVVAAFERG